MPELPEVETIRRDLETRILNKEILGCKVMDKKVADLNLKKIVGCFFVSVNRIGKLLYFKLNNNNFLLIHLKMTGQLLFKSKLDNNLIVGGHEDKAMNMKKFPNKHTRVVIEFKDVGLLFFNDLRRFGYLKVVNSGELSVIKKRFGIEPLKSDFTVKNLEKIFKNRKANVKSLLLNQSLIAGIGNIYADEILFRAGVRPTRKGGKLNLKEIEKIFKASNSIINKAINYRGTTFSDYKDAKGKKGSFSKLLRVYGRKDEKCYKCGNKIKKIKLAGRGTHFCEKCQG